MAEKLHCCRLLKQINDDIEKLVNNGLRELDLTMIQMHVLEFLEHEEGRMSSMKKIEQHLGVSQPTAVGVIKRLEQKELVEPLTNPQDRRVKLVHMTPVGEEKVRVGVKQMQIIEDQLPDALTQEELTEFSRLLEKIRLYIN
ncbi:MAG: MarR family transcriptional regulator [Lachnospiraceae bacterium]|nr:MarR family transcriptional regulator [Lachnospiraceae bacterium]